MRCIVLTLILLAAVIAACNTATAWAQENEGGRGRKISEAEYPALVQQIWTKSLSCLRTASEQYANPDRATAKRICGAAAEELYSRNGKKLEASMYRAPQKYRMFDGELQQFASDCWSKCQFAGNPDHDVWELVYCPSWTKALADRALVINTAATLGIQLTDNTGLRSLSEQLDEYADNYPNERSADPATSVGRHVRDLLTQVQREWLAQRQAGKATDYAHYYRMLSLAYDSADVLGYESPGGWFRRASVAILTTFEAMQAAEKGGQPNSQAMSRATTAFLAETLAWAG